MVNFAQLLSYNSRSLCRLLITAVVMTMVEAREMMAMVLGMVEAQEMAVALV